MNYDDFHRAVGPWGMVFMFLVMVIIIGAVAWVLVWSLGRRDRPSDPARNDKGAESSRSEPERILNERLARGEITPEEYTQRRDLIRTTQ